MLLVDLGAEEAAASTVRGFKLRRGRSEGRSKMKIHMLSTFVTLLLLKRQKLTTATETVTVTVTPR